MKKYSIWNKQDNVITPTGEVFTPEQWKERFPVAALDNITVICAAGEINGAYFGTLGQLVHSYTLKGVDFSSCTTDEEKLEAIEAFEDAEEEAAKNTVSNEELTAASLASIAASMEYQNMLTLEDTEV